MIYLKWTTFCYMNTPILKASKGKKEISFYNENDYEKWKTKIMMEKDGKLNIIKVWEPVLVKNLKNILR